MMNRIERLTAILMLLQDRPHSASEIARQFEVSKRTILRDVQALCEMGVPVIAQEGAHGGYSLPERYVLDPPALSAQESFLMLLALRALGGGDSNRGGDGRRAQPRLCGLGWR